MEPNNTSGSSLRLDMPVVISLSIIAYIFQNILHEFIGHGGATILVGGKLVSWTTAYLEHDLDPVSQTGRRIVAAAGPVMNMLFGLIFWLVLVRQRQGIEEGTQRYPSAWTFLLWLFMTINLLTGTGYFFFSGFSGMGDWIHVVQGFGSLWLWRVIMVVLGIFVYLLSVWISLKELNPLIGSDENRMKRAFKLSMIPYLYGSFSSSLGAIFNPLSILFVFTSAVSSFGGTSGLAWMTQLYSTRWFPAIDKPVIRIDRNWNIVSLAAILLSVHIIFLGRGIRF